MPSKLKYLRDTTIEGADGSHNFYSLYQDEDTGQILSIPRGADKQAALDPISVADRERSTRMKAQQTALEAQKIAMPKPDPVMQHRDRLQGVLDEFERHRQQELIRRRDALMNRPPLMRQPATDAGPTTEMSPGDGISFSDVLAELRRRATGQ